MKKTKKILFLTMLFVGIFCFAAKVNAGTKAWGIQKTTLVCNPEKLRAGDTSTCYFVGTQTKDGDYDADNTGFYLLMYTTQNLKLVGVEANTNLKNANAIFFSNTGTNVGSITNVTSDMPEGLEKFKCNISLYTKKDVDKNTSGCGVFYTKKGSADAFNAGNMGLYGYLTDHISLVTKAGIEKEKAIVLGSITVELPKENNLDGCGDICIAAFGVADAEDWSHGDCTNESMTSAWDGKDCTDANFTHVTEPDVNNSLVDGKFNCYELHLVPTTPQHNTETGAFVSYAVLGAAALIAVSAVVISKKNNRLQKI